MKVFLFILLLPIISSSQPYDTMWLRRTDNGVPNNTFVLKPLSGATQTKFTEYPKLIDSSAGVFATATRLKIKTDSLAVALAATTQTALNAKQNTITVLPFANGGVSGASATSATTGTMTVPMTSSVITITPTGACTFNGTGGVAGQVVTFSITTSGTTSFTLTFGTNFRKVGTLATGTVSARFFSVTFICINGTIWQEVSRTAAQT